MVESSNDSMEMRLRWRVNRLVMVFLPPPGGPIAHTRIWGGRGGGHMSCANSAWKVESIPRQPAPVASFPCRTSACGPPIAAATRWVAVPRTSPSPACSGRPQTPHTCNTSTAQPWPQLALLQPLVYGAHTHLFPMGGPKIPFLRRSSLLMMISWVWLAVVRAEKFTTLGT